MTARYAGKFRTKNQGVDMYEMWKNFVQESGPIMGPISGALVAILGIILNNLLQRSQFEKRLTHERQLFDAKLRSELEQMQLRFSQDRAVQADKEIINLRKEVYLKAAEELSKAASYLFKCTDVNFPDEELSKILTDYGPAVYKTHLVASEETIRPIVAANAYFSKQVLALITMRTELKVKRAAILNVENSAAQNQNRMNLLLQRTRELQDSKASQKEIQDIWNEAEATRIQADLLTKKHQEMFKHLQEGFKDFSQKVFEVAIEFGRLNTEANISLRQELGIPFKDDGKAYKALIKSSATEIQEAFQKWYSSMVDKTNSV